MFFSFHQACLVPHWLRSVLILACCCNAQVQFNDVIMSAMASQITSLTIVYSKVYSGADQRKLQNSASLAFVRGIYWWLVNSQYEVPVTRKMFPFDDVIMVFQQFISLKISTVANGHWRHFPLRKRDTPQCKSNGTFSGHGIQRINFAFTKISTASNNVLRIYWLLLKFDVCRSLNSLDKAGEACMGSWFLDVWCQVHLIFFPLLEH